MDQEPTSLWWGKMTQVSGTQPHRPLTLQTCAAGLQTLLGLLYFAFGGAPGRLPLRQLPWSGALCSAAGAARGVSVAGGDGLEHGAWVQQRNLGLETLTFLGF